MLPLEIKALRKYLGESQTKFAARFRVNQATVCRWEMNGIEDGPAKVVMEAVIQSIPQERLATGCLSKALGSPPVRLNRAKVSQPAQA